MQFLKKYWPTITAALGGVIPFLLPSILAYVQAHPHTAVGVLLAAVVAAYHATAPKDQSALKAILLVACLVCFGSSPAMAQSPTNIYAAGPSFNNAGSPAIAGTALYAHALTDSGTYAFTVIDALPTNLKPFTVTSNVGAGVAQKVFTIGSVSIFVPSSAGISWNGTNTGWAWSTGAVASIPLKKNSPWRIFPTVRVAKSSVSNGAGVQPIFGVLIGYAR